MHILVTGCAGFIGAHVTKKLLAEGHHVVGVDNLNDYYDIRLKQDRLVWIAHPHFEFIQADIADRQTMVHLFSNHNFERVIHLAAQAGVRYSIDYPELYVQTNVVGFSTILECCRTFQTPHFLYASSSSVYGGNIHYPFSTEDAVDHPVSLYAATKKSNELFAHSYSHLYDLPTTGMRFFTVYGPWGRPDMALFKFTKNILNNESIEVYNYGEMLRDFTYIDDIVESIIRLMNKVPVPNTQWHEQGAMLSESFAPYQVVNVGHSEPVKLLHFIDVLEQALGRVAKKNLMPIQPGDVPNTYADVQTLQQKINYVPRTTIEQGIRAFVTWYEDYYSVEEVYYGKL